MNGCFLSSVAWPGTSSRLSPISVTVIPVQFPVAISVQIWMAIDRI